MVVEICHLKGCLFVMTTNLHWYLGDMGNWSHVALLSVGQVYHSWASDFRGFDSVFVTQSLIDKVLRGS